MDKNDLAKRMDNYAKIIEKKGKIDFQMEDLDAEKNPVVKDSLSFMLNNVKYCKNDEIEGIVDGVIAQANGNLNPEARSIVKEGMMNILKVCNDYVDRQIWKARGGLQTETPGYELTTKYFKF